MSGDGIQSCQNCRKTFEQKGETPPCAACEVRPTLWRENEVAYFLWRHLSTQWRVAAYGVIGLDYVAMRTEAAAMHIDITPAVLNKIKALELSELERSHEA